ncbi:SOS response-associated peptidase [Leisingera sp. JC11]|uniref:SOS response-associated peptidase n=1 Tax=Leisingera sp. JC11 TaxID=3042469 RepID=UPI003457074B
MCGRFAAGHLTQRQMLAIMEHFLYGKSLPEGILLPAPEAGYNIKPTQQVQMVIDQEGAPVSLGARWWLVLHWHRGAAKDWKATTFNTKIETAHEKPAFRTAWREHRCVIPALAYYEWTGPKGKKQPWYVTVERNIPVMFFAGLYACLPSGSRSCTILTRPAIREIKHLHPRMPVILSPGRALSWLQKADYDDVVAADYGSDWQGRIKHHQVRPFGRDDDGPELIEPYGLAV